MRSFPHRRRFACRRESPRARMRRRSRAAGLRFDARQGIEKIEGPRSRLPGSSRNFDRREVREPPPARGAGRANVEGRFESAAGSGNRTKKEEIPCVSDVYEIDRGPAKTHGARTGSPPSGGAREPAATARRKKATFEAESRETVCGRF